MGGTLSHLAVTKFKHKIFYTAMEKYFLRCKKLNTGNASVITHKPLTLTDRS
jgi:hypothetical protein